MMPRTNVGINRTSLFLFLILTVFLCFRAAHPHRWSLWSSGDAQSMMAAKNYAKEGFLSLYFLWAPQGYSNVAKLLDNEEMNHQTRASSKFVPSITAKRRLYTHWPSWYAVPHGLLAKMGVEDKTYYQLWAIFLSLGGLIFFYLFLQNLGGSFVALLGSTAYCFSPGFLAFSDSLATMPYDDFFRFAFLYLWVTSRPNSNRWAVWAVYFLGCLTSLDSIAFMPIFAVAYDVFVRKSIRWQSWVGSTIALPAAIGIQFFQNAMYLGLFNALEDWYGYFTLYSVQYSRIERAYLLLTRAFFMKWTIYVPLVGAAFVLVNRSGSRLRHSLVCLFGAGVAFPLLLPGKAEMIYEIRQLAPFIAAIVGAGLSGLASLIYVKTQRGRLSFGLAGVVAGGLAVLWGCATYQFSAAAFKGIVDLHPRSKLRPGLSQFFDKVKKQVPGDKVYFQLGAFAHNPYLSKNDRYNASHMTKENVRNVAVKQKMEMYADGLFLYYANDRQLADELKYLWKNKDKEFTPILLFREPAVRIESVVSSLQKEKIQVSEVKLADLPSVGGRAYRLKVLAISG